MVRYITIIRVNIHKGPGDKHVYYAVVDFPNSLPAYMMTCVAFQVEKYTVRFDGYLRSYMRGYTVY